MVAALIISVSVAIIFFAFFFDERSSSKDFRLEIKELEGAIRSLEAVIRKREDSTPSADFCKEEISRPVDDQDLWDLTPDLVADAVKFNGYVPSKDKDSVSFMVQGMRYSITTERLPYLTLFKQFSIDKDKYDIPAMKKAAVETIQERLLGKVFVSDEGDFISFYVGSVEPKYGHLRDVLVEEIRIVDEIENTFGEKYNRIMQDKEDMRRLEANGIPMEDPRPEGRKIAS